MAGRKARVALYNSRGFADVDPRATEGAILGINLYNPDGTLVEALQFTAEPRAPAPVPTPWSWIIDTPPRMAPSFMLMGA